LGEEVQRSLSPDHGFYKRLFFLEKLLDAHASLVRPFGAHAPPPKWPILCRVGR